MQAEAAEMIPAAAAAAAAVEAAAAEPAPAEVAPKVRRRSGPRSRTSPFTGVTQYRRTGRWEAHIW